MRTEVILTAVAVLKVEQMNIDSILTVLECSGTPCEGAREVRRNKQEHKRASVLDLTDAPCAREGAKALAEALKVNTALHRLDLGFNNISDAVKQQIRSDRLRC